MRIRSIFVFLITLELLLRLNGFFDVTYQGFQNRHKISTGHVYTIMCIGDSNTYLGGENSYPSQLEKILNQRVGGPKFKVINQGLPAAPSQVIMESFEPWLGKYSPDMVVSMMGANDRHSIEESQHQGDYFKFLKPLEFLKVYKLFQGIGKKIKDHVHSQLADRDDRWPLWDPRHWSPRPVEPPKSPFKVVPVKYVKLFYIALEAKSQGNCDMAEEIFIRLLGVSDLEVTFQQRVDNELKQCFERQKKYSELMDTLTFNFNIWDYDVGATNTVRDLCSAGQAKEEVLSMLSDALARKPDSVALNGLLGACYAEYGESAMAVPYLQKIKQIRAQGVIAILKEDYLKLHRILKQHKVKGVYVQYPLRDVNDLKRLLSDEEDYDKMIFVDNEGPFKEALKPEKYGIYFTDRNYDDMGHCTPFGNHILAGNVADAILKYLHYPSS